MSDLKAGFERRFDDVHWKSSTLVEKFSPDQTDYAQSVLGHTPQGDELTLLCGLPEEGTHVDPTSNLLTTAGLGRITNLIIGGGGQAASATAARLGVGDGSTAAAIGDTDLSAAAGSTHRWFMPLDATYPTQAAGVLTVKATFASADGNFAWNEWAVDIGAPAVAASATVNAVLLNHKVASLGTKASGASWALTTTITLS
jgi:hypothetical protein